MAVKPKIKGFLNPLRYVLIFNCFSNSTPSNHSPLTQILTSSHHSTTFHTQTMHSINERKSIEFKVQTIYELLITGFDVNILGFEQNSFFFFGINSKIFTSNPVTERARVSWYLNFPKHNYICISYFTFQFKSPRMGNQQISTTKFHCVSLTIRMNSWKTASFIPCQI